MPSSAESMSGPLRYDQNQLAEDVEKYGLYAYDAFADYITYEQFVKFNGAYLKIPVEKEFFTFDCILELTETYQQRMQERHNAKCLLLLAGINTSLLKSKVESLYRNL